MNYKNHVVSLAAAVIAGVCSLMPLAANATESIATFAANCTTPKTDFNLGETVCARVTGSPLGSTPQRHLNFVNPAGVIVQSSNVTADPQIFSFTVPATTVSTDAGIDVDNRRTWMITSVDNGDAAAHAIAFFAVHDPNQATVDLEIYKDFVYGESDFTAGSNVVSKVYIKNFGPSDAQNVQFSDTAPTNSTFVSVIQESGPTFTCSNAASITTCSAPALANGVLAAFKFTYQLSSDSVDTTGSATVTTSTFETDSSDNSSSTTNNGSNTQTGGGEPCVITCPANITQNNDPNVAGAIVNFPAPTTSGSCGDINTDPTSGSFFPIGTTTVTASDGQTSCSFTVTIVDTRPLVITLNGANPITVECHTSFVDPGATAHNGNGDSVPVTTSGTVDVNTPGTYVITYSATDGTNSVSVSRTVTVVDTLAPNIILNGNDPMIVECHTTFVDPGAIAVDSCVGSVPVTASGIVDANTPGSYEITYSASDGQNSSSATRTVIVMDTTPPVITCPTNVVVSLPPNSTATSMAVDYPPVTATDSCSTATVSSTPVSGSTFSIGDSVVSATATDASGNSSSCQFTVSVQYIFTGFFPPINNLPTVNSVNAGKSVPIKFSLSGNKGLSIFSADSPASGVIPCNSTDPVVDVTPADTAGASTLAYDASSDTYQYVWKTDPAWAGTCRQLVIGLNDGTTHRANFKFK
jgi:hypothetical protein